MKKLVPEPLIKSLCTLLQDTGVQPHGADRTASRRYYTSLVGEVCGDENRMPYCYLNFVSYIILSIRKPVS